MSASATHGSLTDDHAGQDARSYRLLAGTIHLTLALLLVQAILAGVFVSDTYSQSRGGDSVVTAHGFVADALWVVALLAVVVAAVRIRGRAPALLALTGVYFVAALAETGIGHLISNDSFLGLSGNRNGLIALHIPLAVALFALGGYIAFRASRIARA